jgi:hypothetical protein
VHECCGDNVYQERAITGGDIEAAARAAEITVTREYRSSRRRGLGRMDRRSLRRGCGANRIGQRGDPRVSDGRLPACHSSRIVVERPVTMIGSPNP